MNIPMVDSPLSLETKVAEGKTKQIFRSVAEPDICQILQLPKISAHDGKRKDLFAGKDVLSNRTNCNVFRLLHRQGIPVAFIQQLGDVSCLAYYCKMAPLEVVGRFKARGSYRERHPGVAEDTQFDPMLVELYLKTSGKQWMGMSLPDDDLLLIPTDLSCISYAAYRPHEPIGTPVIESIPIGYLGITPGDLPFIEQTTRDVGHVLRSAFAEEGGDLIDFKIEFGRQLSNGKLVVADDLNNDSWRIVFEGIDRSKQGYRNGGTLEETERNYRFVAEVTDRFNHRPS